MSYCPDFRYRMSGHFEICNTFVSILYDTQDDKDFKRVCELLSTVMTSKPTLQQYIE